MQCRLCTVQCTVYNVQCAVLTVQCAALVCSVVCATVLWRHVCARTASRRTEAVRVGARSAACVHCDPRGGNDRSVETTGVTL